MTLAIWRNRFRAAWLNGCRSGNIDARQAVFAKSG
jgi:hypothetical protein